MSKARLHPLGGLIRLLAILSFIAVAFCIFAPLLLNRPIAKQIEAYFDNTIVVGKARLSLWPMRLELHDVHIKNPPNYPEGDMLTIGEVKIEATYTNAQTVVIKNIVYSEVAGYPAFVDDIDNFIAYRTYLEKKNEKIPAGIWRWPVVVDTVQVRNGWIGNQDPMVKLDDENFDPIGRLQNPVSVQHAFIASLSNVINQQRRALPKLMLENVKEKAKGVIDAIGKKLEEWNAE